MQIEMRGFLPQITMNYQSVRLLFQYLFNPSPSSTRLYILLEKLLDVTLLYLGVDQAKEFEDKVKAKTDAFLRESSLWWR